MPTAPARIFRALEKQDEADFAGCPRGQHVALPNGIRGCVFPPLGIRARRVDVMSRPRAARLVDSRRTVPNRDLVNADVAVFQCNRS